MPHWKIKAYIQGTLSRLPDPQRWNRLMQRYVTGSLSLQDDYLVAKWRQSERHAANYRKHVNGEGTFTALELGTGWFPINPVGLVLGGASPVFTIDRQDLLRREQVVEVLERYLALIGQGRIEPVIDDPVERLQGVLEEAADESLGPRELLKLLGIVSIIGDARASSLDDNTIELICSNNTLEHIQENILEDIFRDFLRVLKPAGLMSHHIDLADHYVSFDRSINVYNFLRFSEDEWQRFNNDLQYVNRLRLSDYMALLDRAGWRLVSEDSSREPLEVLRSIPLADEFRDYDESDLAVYETWLQSVPETRQGVTNS